MIYFLNLSGHKQRCVFVYISNYWQSQPLVINSLHIKQDMCTVLCRWGMTNNCSSTLHKVTSKAPPGTDICHSVITLLQGVKVTAQRDSFRFQALGPVVMVTTVTIGLTWFVSPKGNMFVLLCEGVSREVKSRREDLPQIWVGGTSLEEGGPGLDDNREAS